MLLLPWTVKFWSFQAFEIGLLCLLLLFTARGVLNINVAVAIQSCLGLSSLEFRPPYSIINPLVQASPCLICCVEIPTRVWSRVSASSWRVSLSPKFNCMAHCCKLLTSTSSVLSCLNLSLASHWGILASICCLWALQNLPNLVLQNLLMDQGSEDLSFEALLVLQILLDYTDLAWAHHGPETPLVPSQRLQGLQEQAEILASTSSLLQTLATQLWTRSSWSQDLQREAQHQQRLKANSNKCFRHLLEAKTQPASPENHAAKLADD